MSALTLSLLEHVVVCLVPRRHYSASSIRNGSCGPSEPSSETSPKCINREGLGKRRTGTRKRRGEIICHSNVYICGWNPMMSPDNAAWYCLFLRILPNESWFSFLRWGVGGGGGYSERVEVTLYLLTSIFLCSEQRCLHRCWFCFLLYQFWNVSLLTNKNDYIIVHSRKYHNIP